MTLTVSSRGIVLWIVKGTRNGLPTTPEQGPNGTGGDFGAICVEFEAPGDGCVDTATGEFEDTSPQPTTVNLSNSRARVSLDTVAGNGTEIAAVAGSGEMLEASDMTAISGRASLITGIQAQQAGPATLPAPTLANGLPGAD